MDDHSPPHGAIIAKRTPDGFTGQIQLASPSPLVWGHGLWQMVARNERPLGASGAWELLNEALYTAWHMGTAHWPILSSAQKYTVEPLPFSVTFAAHPTWPCTDDEITHTTDLPSPWWCFVLDIERDYLLLLERVSIKKTQDELQRDLEKALSPLVGRTISDDLRADAVAITMRALDNRTRWHWVLRAEIPLCGPEPEWSKYETTDHGDAAPWPYVPPAQQKEETEWWR